MTNPDRPNLVSSETLERLRTAGFSEHEIDDLLARARQRAATAAPPSAAMPQPAAAPFSGPQAPMTGAISNVSAVPEQAPHAIPAVQAGEFPPCNARLRLPVKRRPPPPDVSEPSPCWRILPPLSRCSVLAFRWS